MAKKVVETPLMKQYFEMKQQHPDAVLLFRVGDFYETFCDDAITASEILGITLTRRANGAAASIELAGFPHHALDTYLPKLVRAGKRVAICEQLEDPKTTKTLVKRGITELVTPGVALTDNVLDHKENNFVAAIHFARNASARGTAGVAFLDISTGEFLAAEGPMEYIDKLLGNFAPKEVLVERGNKGRLEEFFSGRYLASELDDWIFTDQSANERLLKQFETSSLKGFGIGRMPLAVVAAGAILHYLDITKHTRTSHIVALRRIEEDTFVRLDKFTVRNLELLHSLGEEGRSLLDVIDRTVSPMGARMLRRWVSFPLKDPAKINARLDAIEYFFRNPEVRDAIVENLGSIGDLERLISKVATLRITPREVVQMRHALGAIEPVKQLLEQADCPTLRTLGEQLNPCTAIRTRIEKEIVDDAPNQLNRGNVVRQGVNTELDELREMAYQGKDYLMRVQRRESEATGITSLKIGYNNVYGYYIEVTNTHRDKVPSDWIRKQTLVNAERYITQELKELEGKILGAKDREVALEYQLFCALREEIAGQIQRLQVTAKALARLDVLCSLAHVAAEHNYTCPQVEGDGVIEIKDGRHPVVEALLDSGPFVPNDTYLDLQDDRCHIITGPNMAGKSTYMRQIALITLLAQIGSFVPARQAHIGVVDAIFTRVGASDDLATGQSTFMVEMNEVATILKDATQNSLIILDEIGRGTSTFDGMSIARAVLEYVCKRKTLGAKTLFATHYHELTAMEGLVDGVRNYSVAVKKRGDDITFLRRIVRGGADQSFGIEVAKLAGVPDKVVRRAKVILKELEQNSVPIEFKAEEAIEEEPEEEIQYNFTANGTNEILEILKTVDINTLTPIEAMQTLDNLRKKAQELS